MADTAPLRIVYVFDDGDESDLALGTISQDGLIETTTIAEGQEAAVATLVEDLNGTERVFDRSMETMEDADRPVMVKTPVTRGEPAFLETLRDTAMRFHKVDLRFDPEVFDSAFALVDDNEPEPDTEEIEAPAGPGEPPDANSEDADTDL